MLLSRWLGARAVVRLRRFLVILVLVVISRGWVLGPVLIVGESMVPTLHSGQIVWVNKLAYLFQPPHRGDLVLVWTGRELWAKRIVGLPEDEIAAYDGMFSINGRPLEEPYVRIHDQWNIASAKIAADHFVIAGDNRQTLIAVVARKRIIGRLMRWSDTGRAI
jgi:signal peptidase I